MRMASILMKLSVVWFRWRPGLQQYFHCGSESTDEVLTAPLKRYTYLFQETVSRKKEISVSQNENVMPEIYGVK
jgi:hypothetical protein